MTQKSINILLIISNAAMAAAAALTAWLPERADAPEAPAEISAGVPEGRGADVPAHSNEILTVEDTAPPTTPPAGVATDNALPIDLEPLPAVRSARIAAADPARMTGNHPFGAEAARVLSGQLEVTDSIRRSGILEYCESFRRAYTTKDIDFIRQVFSDNALIIVGHVVKPAQTADGIVPRDRVKHITLSKNDYIRRLIRIFKANKHIDIHFSDFKIMRHPTMDGIYGVSMRQRYSNDMYSDDGYLFLLWDFRDPERPVIHVRTWQEAASLSGGDDVTGIGDFNLQ